MATGGQAPGSGAAGLRGRPPSTSRRDLEQVALRLFAEQGFEATTIEQIAAGAGVSKRTFFRHVESKADVLWRLFDEQVVAIREALAAAPDGPVMDAVRRAVVGANAHSPDEVPEMRLRVQLIASVGALSASAAAHTDAWEGVVAAYVAARTGSTPDALVPRAVGRATLATCRAAYDVWIERADGDLQPYLDEALQALAAGFVP